MYWSVCFDAQDKVKYAPAIASPRQAHRGRHSYWYWHPVRALKWRGGCHSMVVFVTRVGVGGGGDENGSHVPYHSM